MSWDAGGILTCSRWLSAAIPPAMECQLNRTLKGCKRRASPVYLLIRSAIFRICWHPYQGAQGFGFGFRWYRYAQPPAKDWHPFGMRQQHKKSKGSGHFCIPPSHLLPALKEFVGKSEDHVPWVFCYYIRQTHPAQWDGLEGPFPVIPAKAGIQRNKDKLGTH